MTSIHSANDDQFLEGCAQNIHGVDQMHLSEAEIGLVRDLVSERMITAFQSDCFEIQSTASNGIPSPLLQFKVRLTQNGASRQYRFPDTPTEMVSAISIYQKRYARVVLTHSRGTQRTKAFELEGDMLLLGVYSGRKLLCCD